MKKTATTKIAGIDYSLTSPCICICEIQNEEFDFKNCRFYFFAQTKHQLKISYTNLYPHPQITYTLDVERYNKFEIDIFNEDGNLITISELTENNMVDAEFELRKENLDSAIYYHSFLRDSFNIILSWIDS